MQLYATQARGCDALLPPSQLSSLQHLDIRDLLLASLKDYSTLPKMVTSSWFFMTSALSEITEPKIYTLCNPSRLGEGKEGGLCFCFQVLKLKVLTVIFCLTFRFPLMGIENVNYLG